MEKTIGIDLGTTFCAIATINEHGQAVLIKNEAESTLTPSVIYFEADKIIVGTEAKDMQAFGENNVASFFKRNMGDQNYVLSFFETDYTPEILSSILLKKLKQDAERALGEPIHKAVITVPAYFDNAQREATIRAGRLADIEVLRIINEPTAAAIAFGINKEKEQSILVYDLGGGTFDITIMDIKKDNIQVLGTDGDHELGGKNFDDRIVNYIAQQFEDQYGKNPLEGAESLNDLLVRAEQAKKQLSTKNSTRISITYDGEKGKYDLDLSTFESLTADLLERTQSLTEQLLSDLNLNWTNIDGVLLVGGSTRMPMVRRWVEKMSGKKALSGINVDEAVAMGAAIQANIDANGQDEENLLSLGQFKKIQDVMSHSLGLVAENADRTRYLNSIIITKNQFIPSTEIRPYQLATRTDQNNELDVYMLQGESDRPLDCKILGKYVFSEVEHEPDSLAVIDVKYAYDENGIIQVSAEQRRYKKQLPLRIETVSEDMSWLDGSPKDRQPTTFSAHLNVLISIDLSGSMSGTPLKASQKAAKDFVKKLDLTNTSIGLMVFSDKVKMEQDLCQSAKKLKKGIEGWSIGSVGYGNSGQPFTKVLKQLEDREDPRYLIVLTDGRWGNQNKAIKEADKCKEAGIEIIAIGFGTADKKFLKRIATADENALLTNLEGLQKSLSKIAQVFTEQGGLKSKTENTSNKISFFN